MSSPARAGGANSPSKLASQRTPIRACTLGFGLIGTTSRFPVGLILGRTIQKISPLKMFTGLGKSTASKVDKIFLFSQET